MSNILFHLIIIFRKIRVISLLVLSLCICHLNQTVSMDSLFENLPDDVKYLKFKLGFEFQETSHLCPWALENNGIHNKTLFSMIYQSRQLWKVVIDTQDIEFITSPFNSESEDALNMCMESMLLSWNLLKEELAKQEWALIEHYKALLLQKEKEIKNAALSGNSYEQLEKDKSELLNEKFQEQNKPKLLFKDWFTRVEINFKDNRDIKLSKKDRFKIIENEPIILTLTHSTWEPKFSPQITIQHPLRITIPLYADLFGIFNLKELQHKRDFASSIPNLKSLIEHNEAFCKEFKRIELATLKIKESIIELEKLSKIYLALHENIGHEGFNLLEWLKEQTPKKYGSKLPELIDFSKNIVLQFSNENGEIDFTKFMKWLNEQNSGQFGSEFPQIMTFLEQMIRNPSQILDNHVPNTQNIILGAKNKIDNNLNNLREEIEEISKTLDKHRRKIYQAFEQNLCTPLSGLIFLHALTMVQMTNNFPKDDADALRKLVNFYRKGKQVDVKMNLSFMSRRSFSSMYKDIKKREQPYSETFSESIVKGNPIFGKKGVRKKFSEVNYGEQFFDTDGRLKDLRWIARHFIKDKYYSNNIKEIEELLRNGVITTSMLRNFNDNILCENKKVSSIFDDYFECAVKTVEIPTMRYGINIRTDETIESSSTGYGNTFIRRGDTISIQKLDYEHDTLSPPWFLTLNDSMGQYSRIKISKHEEEYGEAVVECRGLYQLKTLGSVDPTNFLRYTDKMKGEALELFRYLRKFEDKLQKENILHDILQKIVSKAEEIDEGMNS